MNFVSRFFSLPFTLYFVVFVRLILIKILIHLSLSPQSAAILSPTGSLAVDIVEGASPHRGRLLSCIQAKPPSSSSLWSDLSSFKAAPPILKAWQIKSGSSDLATTVACGHRFGERDAKMSRVEGSSSSMTPRNIISSKLDEAKNQRKLAFSLLSRSNHLASSCIPRLSTSRRQLYNINSGSFHGSGTTKSRNCKSLSQEKRAKLAHPRSTGYLSSLSNF